MNAPITYVCSIIGASSFTWVCPGRPDSTLLGRLVRDDMTRSIAIILSSFLQNDTSLADKILTRLRLNLLIVVELNRTHRDIQYKGSKDCPRCYLHCPDQRVRVVLSLL